MKYLGVVLLIFVQAVSCAECLRLDDTKQESILTSYLEIYEDPTNNLTIDQVKQRTFAPHTGSGFPAIRNITSTYWIRFCIDIDSLSSYRWTLENADSHIQEFDLFVDSPTGLKKLEAGAGKQFDVRLYKHKNFLFDLIPSGSKGVYYARVKSNRHNPFILKASSNNQLFWYAINEYYLLGIFYGIMMIIAIYNLNIFFSLREYLYLFYVVYVFCCALLTLCEDGLGFQYIWPQFPVLNTFFSNIAPLLLVLSFTFYSKIFLELNKNFPAIDRVLNWMMIVYVPLFFFDVLITKIAVDLPVYIIPFTIIYVAAILCWRKGYRQARYYLLGYSFMFISIILLLLRMTGIYQINSILSVYSFHIGLVFEVVMLSFALSDRLRIIRTERENAQKSTIEQLRENERLKDRVNRELEQKVKERTREIEDKSQLLENANDKLQIQAEEIQRMNLLLDADNRKLQNNVKDLVKARVMQEDVDFDEFRKIFPTEDSCYRYLSELKWEKGYICRKCGHSRFCDGKERYSKRCTRCRYDESPTAYTIFHRLKFDVLKAFYMVFLVYANKGKITSLDLSQMLKLRQSTCWTFSKKVTKAMKERKKTATSDGHGWSYLILDPESVE